MKHFFCLWILAIALAPPSHAERTTFNYPAACLRTLKRFELISKLVATTPRTELTKATHVEREDGSIIPLGQTIGEGKRAIVRSISSSPSSQENILKIGLSDNDNKAVEFELALYQKLLEDPYQKSLARQHITPILEAPRVIIKGPKNKFKRALIKPRITGTPLEKIIESDVALIPEQKESLNEVIEWAKSLDHSPLLSGKAVDLNPRNIVWVADPAELSALGADPEKPKFMFYEFSSSSGIDWHLYNLAVYTPLFNR